MITQQIATEWTENIGKSVTSAINELRRVNFEHS